VRIRSRISGRTSSRTGSAGIMTTGQLIIVDHVVALLSVAAWSAAGATAAARRTGLALGLLAAAVLGGLARVRTVAVLGGGGGGWGGGEGGGTGRSGLVVRTGKGAAGPAHARCRRAGRCPGRRPATARGGKAHARSRDTGKQCGPAAHRRIRGPGRARGDPHD